MVLGIVVGLGAASLVASRLFGTPFASTPDDSVTYLTAGMALIAIVAVALWRPIHAGSTTSPADVLRS
jgi:hypothetical protein